MLDARGQSTRDCRAGAAVRSGQTQHSEIPGQVRGKTRHVTGYLSDVLTRGRDAAAPGPVR